MTPTLLERRGVRPAVLDDFLAWLNHRFQNGGTAITEDTRLFDDGRVDSIGILHLIAWVERASGTMIPDRLIRVDHFETPATIVERFIRSEREEAR